MTRLVKTDNKQYAEERAERLRGYIKAGKSTDTVEVREFQDGRGQPVYEVWLQHNTDRSRKA